ncbi:hypothetical protein BC629DRAFT_1498921 [Irpex lacteus]|nr:hypothetical protein BC629DRAFT_1498921 [Irpex lacteus]
MQQHAEKESTPSKLHGASANPRSLHSKRSFGSRTAQHAVLDSPAAYDASEEDNDPLTDSGASVISVSDLPASGRRAAGGLGTGGRTKGGGGGGAAGIAARHALAREIVSSDEALDSPTYDGDIESSTTAGPDTTHYSSTRHNNHTHSHVHHHQQNTSTVSIASTLSPSSPPAPTLVHSTTPTHNHVSNATGTTNNNRTWQNSSPPSLLRPTPSLPSRPTEPSPATQLPGSSAPLAFDPAKLTPEDIQAWFKEVIDGPGCNVHDKWYKINPPPKDRPVRIYADGVYDLFHFGHALQLRQAKLAFPSVPTSPLTTSDPASSQDLPSLSSLPSSPPQSHSYPPATAHDAISDRRVSESDWVPGVYMLAGVNSDEQCEEHKSRTVMTHAERCEAVRHCRWVDEVVPDAPWVIDQAFLDKYKIDYVAHDADPYGSAGFDDVYAFCKIQGKFLPTRRTPGISTSDLLARLVSGYRHRVFDKKLAKMGRGELMAEGSDWDESREPSRVQSRAESPNGDAR